MLDAAALLILLLSQAVEPAPSEEPPPAVRDEGFRDEVVVTANRREESLREVAANVTVLGREEIEQSAALAVDDVLRQVPGFSLFRRSSSLVAHPTTQGVSLRGVGPSGASRTLVLLDGVPLNDPFGGWVQWQRIPSTSLDRVEVVRGGGSDLWGSSALGGVVQLLTAAPGAPAVSAVLEGGTHGQLHAGAGAARRTGPLGLSLDVSRVEAGYPVVRRDQRGVIDVDATSEATALYAKIDASVSPATTLSLRGNLFDEERGNGTPLTSNNTFGGYLSAGVAHAGGESEWSAALTAQRQSFGSTFSSQAPDRGSEVPSLDQFAVTAESLGAAAQWTGVSSLTGGLDARWTGAENAEDFLFSAETGRFLRRRRAGGEQLQGGIYLQKEIGLGERWRFTAGGRVDAWSNRAGFRVERTLADGTVLVNEEFPGRDEVAVSPRLSLVYSPRQDLLVRGALYQAFRSPTINELYRPFRVRNDITSANPALESETLTGAELGLDLGAPRSNARLTAFWNRLEDPIANVTLGLGPGVVGACGFVPAGGSCRQRQNLGSVRVAGLEAEAEHRPFPAWSISASYLLSRPEIRDSPREPALEGNRLAQVPEHQAVLRLSHSDPDRLAGSLQVRYTGEQFEDDLNTLELDAAVVADLLLRRRLRPGLDLFVAVENLFDETVEAGLTADGLVSIGAPRLVRGGLRLHLPHRGGTR